MSNIQIYTLNLVILGHGKQKCANLTPFSNINLVEQQRTKGLRNLYDTSKFSLGSIESHTIC